MWAYVWYLSIEGESPTIDTLATLKTMEPLKTRRLCPKCKRGDLDYRTPRAAWVKALFFWLPIVRYRCSSCNKKTYIIVKEEPQRPEGNLKAISSED